MIKTGGGRLTPPPPSSNPDQDSEFFKSLMSTTIDGNEAIYDDDIITPKVFTIC